ncbi:MAG TPA: hypothetical protein VJK52_02255 [Candidatus Nanoarchaeia archaeon]|nr:hypothetical protein [Candidatus Nanoarchaeia archaeon]
MEKRWPSYATLCAMTLTGAAVATIATVVRDPMFGQRPIRDQLYVAATSLVLPIVFCGTKFASENIFDPVAATCNRMINTYLESRLH